MPTDRKFKLPLRLPGICSGRRRPSVRALPQMLIKGNMLTSMFGPRPQPDFTPEPRRWIRPFGAPLPYCKADAPLSSP